MPGGSQDPEHLLDQLILVGDGASALYNSILRLLQNRVGSLGWVGDENGFLNIDGHDAGDKDRQSRNDESEESHGSYRFYLGTITFVRR